MLDSGFRRWATCAQIYAVYIEDMTTTSNSGPASKIIVNGLPLAEYLQEQTERAAVRVELDADVTTLPTADLDGDELAALGNSDKSPSIGCAW